MSKTYDYKHLIDIYISIADYDYLHKDFRIYRENLVAKLEELLGISINPEKRPRNPEVFPYLGIHAFTLWKLFEITLESIQRTRRVGITGSWQEGGPDSSLINMQKTLPSESITQIQNSLDELGKMQGAMQQARYELLYQLIELFFGKIEKVVSSEELLAAGFDDSKEPQYKDYRDYL